MTEIFLWLCSYVQYVKKNCVVSNNGLMSVDA